MPCPFCKGTGMTIKFTHYNPVSDELKRKAFLLRQQGESLRGIARKLKLSNQNPQRVDFMIKSYYKKMVRNDSLLLELGPIGKSDRDYYDKLKTKK